MDLRITIPIILFFLLSSLSLAYSGSGTIETPYLIYNCSDLDQIDNLNISGYFKLNNDIDCLGYDFNPQVSPISNFYGDLDGNGKKISNVKIRKSNGFYFGLISHSNGTIHNLILDSWDLGGFKNDSGIYSQNCGLIGETLSPKATIYEIGLINFNLSCGNVAGILTGWGHYPLKADNINIYKSKINIFDSSGSITDSAGLIGLNNHPFGNLSNIILYADMNSSSNNKYAINYNGLNINPYNILWVNDTFNLNYGLNAKSGDIKINSSVLYDPTNPLLSNFSDLWVFSNSYRPIFNWELDNLTYKIEKYKINYSFCDLNNWGMVYDIYSGSPKPTKNKPFLCYAPLNNSYFISNKTDKAISAFCYNYETKVFNFMGYNHTFILPYNYQYAAKEIWTNYPYMSLTSENNLSLSILWRNYNYLSLDINISSGNITNINLYTRCDGAMSENMPIRCILNISWIHQNTTNFNDCGLWIGDQIKLNNTLKSSNNWISYTENNIFDCDYNYFNTNQTLISNGGWEIPKNISFINCIFNETANNTPYNFFLYSNIKKNGSIRLINDTFIDNGFEPLDIFIGNYIYPYTQYDISLNNTIIKNNQNIYISIPIEKLDNSIISNNTYIGSGSLIFSDSHNLTISNIIFSEFGLNINGGYNINIFDNQFYSNVNINNGYDYHIQDNLFKGVNLYLNPISYSLITNNIFDNAGLAFGGNMNERDVFSHNTIQNLGNLSCFGDCDADPDVYNATSYNNWRTFEPRYFNNSIFEYNNFTNITGALRFRYIEDNNTIRYNNLNDIGIFYIRDSGNNNNIYENNIYYSNARFSYFNYGFYIRDSGFNNTISNNIISGAVMRGLYSYNTNGNYYIYNKINFTFNNSFYDEYGEVGRGIYLSNSDNNLFEHNDITIPFNYTLYSDSLSNLNTIQYNTFRDSSLIDEDNNTFYCNSYNNLGFYNIYDPCLDYTPPICSGLENKSYKINDSIILSFNCSDDTNLLNITFSCTNGFYFENLSINQINYSYQNSSIVTQNFTCSIIACDNSSNCFTGSEQITYYIKIIPQKIIRTFQNTNEALTIIFFWVFWLILAVLTLVLRGKHGATIQLLNLFQVIISIFTSFLTFAVSPLLAFTLAFIGIGLFFGKIYEE